MEKVIQYIEVNKCKPSKYSEYEDVNLMGRWIACQLYNSKNRINIMKCNHVYEKWMLFINKYNTYFTIGEQQWMNMFEKVKEYIDTQHCKPHILSKDDNIKKMGTWIIIQQKNAKKRAQIMMSEEIYIKWMEFIDLYKIHFLTQEENWHKMFEKVKEYINMNKCRPSASSKDNYIKTMRRWINRQQIDCKKRLYVMSSEEIYNKWTEFINLNLEIFQTKEQYFDHILKKK